MVHGQKGYGFIQPQDGGKDVFVHISAVERAGLPSLNEGQVVEYEEVSNPGKTIRYSGIARRGRIGSRVSDGSDCLAAEW